MKDNVSKVFEDIRRQLDIDDESREKILRISRKCVRSCAESIRAIHRRELATAEEKLLGVKLELIAITELIAGNAIFENNVATAFQEYVEALQLLHFVKNGQNRTNNLISLKTIQLDFPIPYTAFLHGLCDLIGELRRFTLDSIRLNDIEQGEQSLSLMDDTFIQLTTLDYPNGLLPGIRRKTDIARNIIERTRGDLTLASSRKKVIKKLDDFMKS